jgi:hypothetical protein
MTSTIRLVRQEQAATCNLTGKVNSLPRRAADFEGTVISCHVARAGRFFK